MTEKWDTHYSSECPCSTDHIASDIAAASAQTYSNFRNAAFNVTYEMCGGSLWGPSRWSLQLVAATGSVESRRLPLEGGKGGMTRETSRAIRHMYLSPMNLRPKGNEESSPEGTLTRKVWTKSHPRVLYFNSAEA